MLKAICGYKAKNKKRKVWGELLLSRVIIIGIQVQKPAYKHSDWGHKHF